MRMGYTGNRNELMNTAYLPSKAAADRVGFGQEKQGEPAFRIYAKNSATKEVQDLQYKHRNRARLTKLADQLGNNTAERDQVNRSKNAHTSPQTMLTLSFDKAHPYLASQGGTLISGGPRNPLTDPVIQ